MSKSPKKSAVGRPAGSDKDSVRQRLLDAARQLFLSYEFKAVSIKRIAETAGVNGAMVNYYFGSKHGLYLAMVEEVFTPLEKSLREMAEKPDQSVASFIGNYCQLLAENPWWANFIVREVLFGDGEMQKVIMQKFSAVMSPLLMGSIQKEIISGNFRQDLKPEFTFMSLMGITVFPFLAKPLLEAALGLKLTADTVKELADHNAKLFLHGVKVNQQGGDGHV